MPTIEHRFLYANINDTPIDERPMNVFIKNENLNIVVGDFFNNRVFSIRYYDSTEDYSFELFGCQLFIGFDEYTKLLLLTSDETKWKVNSLGSLDGSKIHTKILGIEHRWEMNIKQTGRPIILSNDLSTTPPAKQKWKFATVRTIDV